MDSTSAKGLPLYVFGYYHYSDFCVLQLHQLQDLRHLDLILALNAAQPEQMMLVDRRHAGQSRRRLVRILPDLMQ